MGEGVSPENSPENSRGGDAWTRPAGASSQPEWRESGARRPGSRLHSWREPSAPLHGELPLGSNPPPRSGEPTSGAKGTTSFAGGRTSHEGRQSSVRETHLDQLHLRARGTTTPRSRLAGSTLPYASHFHPLPCLGQTSRFTWE